jgi:Uncharacterized protein conserved in bacteria (DUF2252)
LTAPAVARLADPALERAPERRAELGKAARQAVPREAQADCDLRTDRPDPVELLERQAASRVPGLLPIRYGRMLASPLAYLRGAALAMAGDLAGTRDTGFTVQACGDAHLGNFGIFASPERRLVFDINDFDETLPAPWEWDVKRLAASLEVAGRVSSYSGKQRRRLVLEAAGQYRVEMRRMAGLSNLGVWYSRGELDELQRRFRAILSRHERALSATDLAGEDLRGLPATTRAADGLPAITAEPPLVVPVADLDSSGAEAAGLAEIVTGYQASLEPDRRYLISQFAVADMARKVSGVGSVGMRCWVVLLSGRDRDDQLFLQLKEAQASVLSDFAGASAQPTQGQRVVKGQQIMQAASDMFIGWYGGAAGQEGAGQETSDQPVPASADAGRDYYIRQLRDWKFTINTAGMRPETMRSYAALCGRTLARAHARSGDRIAIGAYLGGSPAFESAIEEYAASYADQNERDYATFRAAVKSGRLSARPGV